MTTSRTINAGIPTGLLTLAVPRVTLGAAVAPASGVLIQGVLDSRVFTGYVASVNIPDAAVVHGHPI